MTKSQLLRIIREEIEIALIEISTSKASGSTTGKTATTSSSTQTFGGMSPVSNLRSSTNKKDDDNFGGGDDGTDDGSDDAGSQKVIQHKY